jgi:riboflavin kinase/FMN adenylyltransferase
MRGLVVGPDFTLGRNREGDIETLRTIGKDMGFMVTTVPPVMINGEVVSSTAIRKALIDGDLKKVRDLMGDPFSLHGRVITGARRGKELGFPTANLDIDPEQALPAEGVYASRAYTGERAYKSMTYIGKNPTFGGRQQSVEVYILDYQGNLYGQELRADIIERLRSEKKFNTAEELRQQIASDIKQGISVLDSKDND